MTTDDARRYDEQAVEERREGALTDAAAFYTCAGYRHFGAVRRLPPITGGLERDSDAIARGVESMLAGALCHRIAGDTSRTHDLAAITLRIVENFFDNESCYDDAAFDGLYAETAGDFAVVAGRDGAEAKYAEAITAYEQVQNHIGWSGEPVFGTRLDLLKELLDATGTDLSEETHRAVGYESLTRRAEFKRDQFPVLVEQVVDAGGW